MREYWKIERSDDKKLNNNIERTKMYYEKLSERLYGTWMKREV